MYKYLPNKINYIYNYYLNNKKHIVYLDSFYGIIQFNTFYFFQY